MREIGNIECYDVQRAFGFIRRANANDIFFHLRSVSAGSPVDLVRGALVESDTELDVRSGRPRAVDLKVLPHV
jgi:cold shock CspA family protein